MFININLKCTYIANFRKKAKRGRDSLIKEINVY